MLLVSFEYSCTARVEAHASKTMQNKRGQPVIELALMCDGFSHLALHVVGAACYTCRAFVTSFGPRSVSAGHSRFGL